MAFDYKQFYAILTVIGPVILLTVPGGAQYAPLVPLIVTGIADAQKKPGATGAEKKAYVLSLVTKAVAATNIVKPKTIDETLIVQAAGLGIDAVITSINAVAVAHAKLPDVPAILVPPTDA